MPSAFKVADFVLNDWGVWASDSVGREASGMHSCPNCAEIPGFIPKLQQRRLSPLARAVFNAIDRCIEPGESLPTVFSSAHGEVGKALEMLKTIQAGEELSPAAFSLSVHNAIAGLYSIAYRNQQEITVMAPGGEAIGPAFAEALGMLREGVAEVLVVLYDEPIAGFYPVAPFALNGEFTCALAMRLALAGKGIPLRLSRVPKNGKAGEQPVQLPLFVDFLRGGGAAVDFWGGGWRWEKI
ncbi:MULTISPECIES: beta-ketoacyl synthase chain length factor [Methylomicrobium]|uniref:Beta-ketoacyl synthase-like N-terminal domain-containing protein n=1 Tax=Methylomicrobium album BG8 TaxID=686340 RepID=H8GI39_METAL|nr:MULTISPECIES: beta-ketoacyl synthase chain length factor [Methylomicrobium]EIC30183.1 hypothetical protein Metal_2463 [Methylomicrobium album BG8]